MHFSFVATHINGTRPTLPAEAQAVYRTNKLSPSGPDAAKLVLAQRLKQGLVNNKGRSHCCTPICARHSLGCKAGGSVLQEQQRPAAAAKQSRALLSAWQAAAHSGGQRQAPRGGHALQRLRLGHAVLQRACSRGRKLLRWPPRRHLPCHSDGRGAAMEDLREAGSMTRHAVSQRRSSTYYTAWLCVPRVLPVAMCHPCKMPSRTLHACSMDCNQAQAETARRQARQAHRSRLTGYNNPAMMDSPCARQAAGLIAQRRGEHAAGIPFNGASRARLPGEQRRGERDAQRGEHVAEVVQVGRQLRGARVAQAPQRAQLLQQRVRRAARHLQASARNPTSSLMHGPSRAPACAALPAVPLARAHMQYSQQARPLCSVTTLHLRTHLS